MKVQIYAYNHSIIDCSVEYIGMLGMQVNSIATFLECGSKVEVELSLAAERGTLRCRMPAVITQKTPHSVGLTFLFQEMKTLDLLRNLLECYLLEPVFPDAKLACF